MSKREKQLWIVWSIMWIGETGVGCLFILFATNETINKQ